MKTGTQLQDLHKQRASVGASFRSGLHPPKKTNIGPLPGGLPQMKLIFQPQCFRYYVSFQGGYILLVVLQEKVG